MNLLLVSVSKQAKHHPSACGSQAKLPSKSEHGTFIISFFKLTHETTSNVKHVVQQSSSEWHEKFQKHENAAF